VRLAWEQITAVYAYKRDCWTVDQISLILGDDDRRTWIEVTEEDEGYQSLVGELPRHLPGCQAMAEWWPNVAFPPFETNKTNLYSRPV
jgi:hypothetical protein